MAETKEVKDRNKEIAKAMAEINAKYKCDAIVKGANKLIEKIPTGLISIDRMMGGGIPRRRFTMFYGSKGAAKTSLCYKLIALIQESGGVVAYIDSEHAYDPEWARELGVDIDALVFNQPKTLEESLTVLEKLVHLVDLVVIDSIVAVSAGAELSREIEQETMALIPRKLSQFFRRSTPAVGKGKAAVILVNQSRMDLGAYTPIEKYPGGLALAHACSFIMKMRRASNKDWPTDKVDGKEVEIGIRINVTAEKSKISSCEGTKTCFDLLKEAPHFDEYSDLFLIAELDGVIVRTGAWYNYKNEKFQGRDEVIQALRDNEKFFEEIKAEVMKDHIKEPKTEKAEGEDDKEQSE